MEGSKGGMTKPTRNFGQRTAFRENNLPGEGVPGNYEIDRVDSGSKTSPSIECIHIDEDNSELSEIPTTSTPTLAQALAQNDGIRAKKKEIRDKLEMIVKSLKKRMSKEGYRMVKGQLLNAFDKVGFRNAGAAMEMKAFVDEIVKELDEKPNTTVKLIKKLHAFLKSRGQSRPEKHNESKPEDETAKKERKSNERIVMLEKKLVKMEKEIEDYGKQEVDLSNETNSSYLIRNRIINKYIEYFNLICKLKGCNNYTGRPIEKRIILQEGITKCAELSEAVEKFVNSKPILFVPDFCDIKKAVSDFNAQARPPPLCDSEIHSTAKELFNEVLRIIRNRRFQDMENVLPAETVASDPAENDEELRKKLEENAKLRKSEQEVIERFVKEQEESKEVAMEVEEDPESSAAESDE